MAGKQQSWVAERAFWPQSALYHLALKACITPVCMFHFVTCHTVLWYSIYMSRYWPTCLWTPWDQELVFFCAHTIATQETLNLWKEVHRVVRHLPKPLSIPLPKTETKGWERRGKDDDPDSQCWYCSPTPSPPPTNTAREWLTQSCLW